MKNKKVWLVFSEELADDIVRAGEVATVTNLRELPEILRALPDHQVIVLAEPGQEFALLAILRDSKAKNVTIWFQGKPEIRSRRFNVKEVKAAVPGGQPVVTTQVSLPASTSTWKQK